MRFPFQSALLVATGTLFLAACGGDGGDDLSGEVVIDGSSTVFPVAEAVAEEFQIAHPNVRVSVGISGSGGGFTRFCNGETDLSNASRPISARRRKSWAERVE